MEIVHWRQRHLLRKDRWGESRILICEDNLSAGATVSKVKSTYEMRRQGTGGSKEATVTRRRGVGLYAAETVEGWVSSVRGCLTLVLY
jgi:hypothetical protein